MSMRFMMLLKSDAKTEAGVLPDEKLLTDMGNYNEAMVNAGVMLGGEGLHPSSKGARIRITRGKTQVIDGPFAEAKEVIAGFFLLQTKSKEEAIEWAKRMPGGDSGGEVEVELRPLVELEDFPVDPAEKPDGWRAQEQRARDEAATAKKPAPSGDKGLRFISLLKADKHTEAGIMASEKLLPKLLADMGALMQEMTEAGVLLGGDGLKPSSEGARIRFSGAKRTVIDGPFTETKELVAGYTIYRAKSKAEAIEWARRCLQIHMDGTGIEEGEIEVRQVFETDEIPVTAAETPDGWREQEKRLRERLV
jgi:hypothetical protein